jgi:hypothetical protein
MASSHSGFDLHKFSGFEIHATPGGWSGDSFGRNKV